MLKTSGQIRSWINEAGSAESHYKCLHDEKSLRVYENSVEQREYECINVIYHVLIISSVKYPLYKESRIPIFFVQYLPRSNVEVSIPLSSPGHQLEDLAHAYATTKHSNFVVKVHCPLVPHFCILHSLPAR